MQYDSKSGWGGFIVDLYKAKNGIIEISDEASKLFDKYQKNGKNLTKSTSKALKLKKFDIFINKNKLADESLIKFLGDTKYDTKDLANYQQYLKDTGQATLTFTDFTQKAIPVLKSFSASMMSMGVNWLISEAIGAGVTVIDNYIHRVEKAQEALSSSVSTY